MVRVLTAKRIQKSSLEEPGLSTSQNQSTCDLPDTWSSLGVSPSSPWECSSGGEEHLKKEGQISEIRLVIRFRVVSSPSTFSYLFRFPFCCDNSAWVFHSSCFITGQSLLFFSHLGQVVCFSEFVSNRRGKKFCPSAGIPDRFGVPWRS